MTRQIPWLRVFVEGVVIVGGRESGETARARNGPGTAVITVVFSQTIKPSRSALDLPHPNRVGTVVLTVFFLNHQQPRFCRA